MRGNVLLARAPSEASLLDAEGSVLGVQAKGDDYRSQPAAKRATVSPAVVTTGRGG